MVSIMQTSFMIAHKRARFLQIWKQSYRKYNGSNFLYNCCEYPGTTLLPSHGNLVHNVQKQFTDYIHIKTYLYAENHPITDWVSKYYAINTNERWRQFLKNRLMKSVTKINENTIKTYACTYGQIARLVLYNTTDIIQKRAKKASNQLRSRKKRLSR